MPSTLRRYAVGALASAFLLASCGGDDKPTSSEPHNDRPSAKMRDPALTVASVIQDLDSPTAMAFVDGVLLVTEKTTGRVRVFRDGKSVGEAIDLAVNGFDERGLLGIVAHPDFASQPFVYLHWTWRGDGEGPDKLLGADSDESAAVPPLGNRIDRFRWADNKLTFDRNIVAFRSNTLSKDTSGRVRGNHDAGPLAFGPDGKLYTMLGDQNLRGQLQNIVDGPPPTDDHLTGVILRLNDDGTTPSDNPFFAAGAEIGGDIGENIQQIYVYGVRNSFGLAFEPGSGALWQTENGDDAYDEINVFDAGSNSGWIQLQGLPATFESFKQIEVDTDDGFDNASFPPDRLSAGADAAQQAMFSLPGSKYTPPVLTFVHPPALTALGFVSDERLGSGSKHTVWVGTVLTGSLLRYQLAEDGRSLELDGALADRVDNNDSKGDLGESAPAVAGTGFGVVTAIHQGPDGDLYVLSLDSGTVYRISAK